MDDRGSPEADIHHMLSEHTVMSLTAGEPHVVSLFYAHDEDLSLYWVSDVRTGHSRQIGAGRRAAVCIAGQYLDFSDIHGLQMTGFAEPLDGDEAERGRALLTARFAFLGPDAEPSEATRRLAMATVYRFRPERITVIDNRRGFAVKRGFAP